MDVGALIESVKQKRLGIDYVYIGAAALLIYDYFLTLRLEAEFIWFSRWTYTKVLLLVVRYASLVSTILLLHNKLFPDIPIEGCKTIPPLSAWAVTIQLFLTDVVIAIRTWAVWNKHRIVGVVLVALSLGNLVFSCVKTSRFLATVEC